MRPRSKHNGLAIDRPARFPLLVLLLIQIALLGMESCAAPKSARPASATEPTSKNNTEQGSMLDDQFLPEDGKADWLWNVTPLQGGQKELKIDAYMVLNAKLPNGQPMMREVQS